MNASRKISILYSGITIGLVLIAGFVFYIISSHYTENLYFKYMNEKAHAVADEKFSKDELDPIKYQNVVRRRKNSIPTSKELFINIKNRRKANRKLSKYLKPEQLRDLYQNKVINFYHGDQVGTAFIYYDNEGTFAVVVLSRNPYGKEISHTIRWYITFLVLISAVILYLISWLYATRMVDRIDKNYRIEKMFVNNASHEINNPLTAIQGECEIALMRQRSTEEYRNSLQRISWETNRIIKIMQQLLQFSHANSKKINSEYLNTVDIEACLQQFRDERTDIIIKNNFKIRIDEGLLSIALHNLINNAHKYSGDKKVFITVNKGNIMIKDQGIGISEADLKHIFEPFYRAANTRGISGHGIGLALAKQILEKYGAHIKVVSQENKGTTFTVNFQKIL